MNYEYLRQKYKNDLNGMPGPQPLMAYSMSTDNVMRKIGLLAAGLALASHWSPCGFAALTSNAPVEVLFGDVETVFLKTESARRAMEITTRVFSKRDCVSHATILSEDGKIWCKRTNGEFYTQVFREKNVSLESLLNLRSATISELTNLLGKPMFVEGPIDHEITTIWWWRTCNGQPGAQFAAIEAIAGFNAVSSTRSNALFFAVRVGRRK